MQKLTEKYEVEMQPVDDEFQPIQPKATDLLEWVKKYKPELYQQMLDGVEIGFQGLIKQYKKWLKENNK